MKTIIKRIFFLVIFVCLLFTNSTHAQSNVKILDLALYPVINYSDTIANDSIELMVVFKINKPEEATKAQFLMGTVKDGSDIFSATALFTTVSGVTSLTYHGVSIEVVNYQVSFRIKVQADILKQNTKSTLYVETNTGVFTNRIYF